MNNIGNWFLIAVALFAVYLFLQGRVPGEARLSPVQVRDAMQAQKELQLIDVRTEGEYAGGHLFGARNIPLDRLSGSLAQLAKDKPLIVYCHSGRRSSAALRLLRSSGFAQAKHMEGGIAAWQGNGLPVGR